MEHQERIIHPLVSYHLAVVSIEPDRLSHALARIEGDVQVGTVQVDSILGVKRTMRNESSESNNQ
jgi:hypothetical protein